MEVVHSERQSHVRVRCISGEFSKISPIDIGDMRMRQMRR